jgi:hypothetical protein
MSRERERVILTSTFPAQVQDANAHDRLPGARFTARIHSGYDDSRRHVNPHPEPFTPNRPVNPDPDPSTPNRPVNPHPQPSTLNPTPETLDPRHQTSTLTPTPSTLQIRVHSGAGDWDNSRQPRVHSGAVDSTVKILCKAHKLLYHSA